jgi:ketosteroid isomerase-like protein
MKLNMSMIAAFGWMLLSASSQAWAADPLSQTWATDWSAKRLDAVVALYAPQPVFLPTIGPRWVGLAVIRKNFAGLLKMYDPHVVLHSIETGRSGKLGYDSGTYNETITPVKGGKSIPSGGAYLFLFQRERSGEWKILEQTWTSFDQPPKL